MPRWIKSIFQPPWSISKMEHSQKNKEPSPRSPLSEQCKNYTAEGSTDRRSQAKETEAQISHSSRRKCNANYSNGVRHHERGTDATHRSGNDKWDDTSCTEAIDQRPDYPPCTPGEQNVFMAVHGADPTTHEDKCSLCHPGIQC